MSEQTNREKEIFNQALEMGSPEARLAYVKGACGTDDELRERVEALLKAYEAAGGFIPTRAGVAAEIPTVVLPVQLSEGPGTVIDRYKLLEKIGEGGFGAVYVAEQREPVKRRVALKIIKLGMDTRQVVARFEAERQALALMDHPNIAKVLDAGATEAGRPYFVMELVRGIPITQYCDENYLSADERLRLFMLVCQAIQHAHQKGIIHRDIKPSNVLLTVNDGVPVPKVIDFGIAKATQGELTDKTIYTQFQQFIGTPAYMSPEQADMTSLDIDTRSDIYALGVLLYELLVGKTPFDGKELLMSGLDEMRRTIREKEPVRPSTRLSQDLVAADVRRLKSPDGLKPETEEEVRASSRRLLQTRELIHLLRGDVDWIVMKCLEKDRTRRYETANGLAADINRFLTNEPVMARPPSTAYRFRKAFRRNKLAFTAASAVGVVLVAGIMVSTWQAFEASRARDAEQKQRIAAQTERDKAQTAQKEAERAQQAEKQARQHADQERAKIEELLHDVYAARMTAAQSAWEQNNVGRVRQLLDDTATYPERGFEWFYWQRQTHLEIRTLRGHTGQINSVALSPDGKRIVTGSGDRTAKVWDAASGEELVTLKGHGDEIRSVAFSPDGQRIATGSKDSTAKLWEVRSGSQLLTLKGHSTWINSVAFSPDGQRIVTGSGGQTPKDGDNTAKVWELASGKELVTLSGHTDGIFSVAFSTNGQRIVTASRDTTAKVWEAANGKEILTFRGHSDWINGVAFSPDGQRIVTGSDDRTAKVWDAASGKELLTLRGHSGFVQAVAFSPDGQRIATGGADQTGRVWDVATGEELLAFKGHAAQIWSVAFSPDGRTIVTSSGDWMSTAENTAKIWDVSSSKEMLTLEGHSGGIMSALFSPDGQRIVTSADGTARVWDGASGKELLTLNGREQISFAAFSSDGQRIVTCESDRTAKIWDAVSGKQLLTLKGHTDNVLSAAFSPDNQRIVTGSFDETGKVWDAASGKELLTLRGGAGRVWSVAFSPDGQRIVTGTDGPPKVWDAASGKKLLVLNGHRSLVVSVAFSPDGQRIVTGSSDGTAKVWDTKSGKELLSLEGHGDQVWSVAFSPDGRRIVTSSADRTAKVWESISGKELLTLKGHGHFVRSAAFSPDGKRIVTGSWDKTAKVWKAATLQQVTAWQQEEQAAVQYVAHLPRQRSAEQERQQPTNPHDEGAIKHWLVLAPIALATGQSGAEALDTEQIESEGQLRPRARSMGIGETKWQELVQEYYVIDFNEILGRVTGRSVAYAVCYIRSEAEQHGLQMLVGSDDEAKVYLNGKQVHKSSVVRDFVSDQDMVPDLTLNPGLNVLVFKVVNEGGPWMGSIRFTDIQGNPVKGIKVTLDPNTKDSP